MHQRVFCSGLYNVTVLPSLDSLWRPKKGKIITCSRVWQKKVANVICESSQSKRHEFGPHRYFMNYFTFQMRGVLYEFLIGFKIKYFFSVEICKHNDKDIRQHMIREGGSQFQLRKMNECLSENLLILPDKSAQFFIISIPSPFF